MIPSRCDHDLVQTGGAQIWPSLPRTTFTALVQNSHMTGQRPDLLAKLEQDLTDRYVPLADLLRTCIVLGGRTRSTRLSEWASSELKGYTEQASIPAYRVVTAPIRLEIGYMSTPRTEKEILKDHDYPLVLDESIDRLDAIAAYSESKRKPFLVPVDKKIFEHYSRKSRKMLRGTGTGIDGMDWVIEPPLIRGVLGQIRTALAEFIAELRAEVGDGDQLPSSSQTDKALQVALPAAVFTNSNVTIMTTGKGDIMPDDDRTIIRDNKTTIRGSAGNISVASAKVAQVNSTAPDIAKIKEFADLVRQVSPTLGFASGQETGLQAAADELTHAADSPVPEVGRIRQLLDGTLRLLRTAGRSAARDLAIRMGDELIREIGGEIVRELPH